MPQPDDAKEVIRIEEVFFFQILVQEWEHWSGLNQVSSIRNVHLHRAADFGGVGNEFQKNVDWSPSCFVAQQKKFFRQNWSKAGMHNFLQAIYLRATPYDVNVKFKNTGTLLGYKGTSRVTVQYTLNESFIQLLKVQFNKFKMF